MQTYGLGKQSTSWS